MRKLKRFLLTAGTTCTLLFIFCERVSASIITKDEAQAVIDSVGKEKATGNILIWFLCAIAFLKVAQKIDSHLASLGINVGHTGGSLFEDAKAVARTLGIGKGGSSGRSFGSGSPAGGGLHLAGLAGAIGHKMSSSAAAGVTGRGGNPIMDKMFDSSLSSGGKFANDIIGKIAKGDMSKTGSITGDKAASALTSYLGGKPGEAPPLVETSGGSTGESLSTPSISDSPVNVPEAQGSSGSPEIGSVPFDDSIGGADLAGTEMLGSDIGAIAAMEDGTEESHPHIPQPSFDENPIQNADYTTSPASDGDVESPAPIPTGSGTSPEPSSSGGAAELPGFEPITGSEGDSAAIGTSPFIVQPEEVVGSIGTGGIATTEKTSSLPTPADSSASVTAPPATGGSPVVSSSSSASSVPASMAGSGSITIGEAPFTTSPAAPTITSGGISASGSGAGISVGSSPIGSSSIGSDSGSSVTIGESPYVSSLASSSPVETASAGYDAGSSAASYAASTSSGVSIGPTSPTSGSDSVGSFDTPHTSGSAGYSAGSGSVQPTYSDVEIGGGRMMGTETTPANPGGIKFGMYDTQQYAEPTGDYSIVKTIDGSKWYKQYAIDTVQKTPYRNEDGKIAYKEELVKTLPQVPKRKDKM